MRGRDTSEVSDIELLDVEPTAATQVDHVETVSSNRWGAAVGVGLCLAAAAFVIGVGNSPAPVQPPDVTIDQDGADEEPAEIELPLTEQEQLEAEYGVAIGDGPGLAWQSVEVDVDTRSWSSVGDQFVADNGSTEWSIGPGEAGPTVTQRPSLLLEYPGYRLSAIDGRRLLVPNDAVPDHFILLWGDATTRVALPPSDQPTSSLFTTNTWTDGAVIGDRLVAQISTWISIDFGELQERTGEDLSGIVHAEIVPGGIQLYPSTSAVMPDPIPFEDAGLTDAETTAAELLQDGITRVITVDLTTSEAALVDLADLKYTSTLVVTPTGEVLLDWTDTSELRWKSSTADGLTWTTARSDTFRWVISSGTQLFDLNSQFTIDRSIDGRTWTGTTDPLRNQERTFAGDVIALGRPWGGYGIDTGVTVETGTDFWLTLFDQGQRFELRGIRTFETPLLEGWIGDPSSGAEWDWLAAELVFTDQRTGEELLRVSEHAVDVASAEARPVETIALARWPLDVQEPEWLITSPVELFGEGALAVDFIGGDQQILAIVTTSDGFDMYLADTAVRS